MSTNYQQTYSNNKQAFIPQNPGYQCAQVPSMVPMGSPMFQPFQMTGPVPHQMYLPPVNQMNSGFQAMSLGPQPSLTGSSGPLLPLMSACSSMDSLRSVPMDSLQSVPMDSLRSAPMDSLRSVPSMGHDLNMTASMSDALTLPFVQVGSMEAYPNMQRTPSPGMGMVPSYSPQQSYTMMAPMISLMPIHQQSLPPQLSSNGVTVTGWGSCSPNRIPTDPVLPEPVADPNMLGYRVPRANSVGRSRSPPSRSNSRSMSDYSVCSDREREYSVETPAEPSKRELVNNAFAKLQAMFGLNFDQNGNRGENILRLKVKTRTALEQIVPFIEFCQRENLIVSVSCPISTKKGRQQVRGFLAYLQMKNAQDADRVEELIKQYNDCNGSPFKTWHRNPPSTWKTQA